MYRILLYKDRQGRAPVSEYLQELEKQKSKDARIRSQKILAYIDLLEEKGLALTANICKNIGEGLWELRPTKDRVFFVGWVYGAYVLLHCYEKRSQKTPLREIERAKKEIDDFRKRTEAEDYG